MIKDKILLVHDYPIVKNEGGPRGYFNKCIYLNEPENIITLNNALLETKIISFKKRILIKKDFIRNKILKKEIRNKQLANKFIKIEKHKFLYFHDIYSFNDVEHLINKDQVVIFQSHSPELPSIEELNNGASKKNHEIILKIEKNIFERANYLILPNKECLPIYKSVLTKNIQVKYLTTGIKPIKNTKKIPLNDDKINLFYIGRRNEVKGFPVLLKTFKKVLKQRDDIRLFIAGNGEKINEENIIDLGATSVAYDWIHSMDYVLCPNKSSYFDLNVIESIAIGTPLIMTTTEGHHFFKNRKGIIPITYNNFYDVLVDKSLIHKTYKNEVKKDLNQLYENELSNIVYKKNLKKMCKTIILENY